MMSPGRLPACLLALCIPFGEVWAEIYAYTAEDGTVSLSNVPADARYKLLIPGAQHERENSPEPGRSKAGPVVRNTGYDDAIHQASMTYGLESALLHAVVSAESQYNAKALSPKGAAGLMQLMPETARRYGVSDRFDPRQNLNGGAHYLSDLLRMFNNDVSLALAAYNAGEQAVMRHGNRIPPFRETRLYVPRVLELYQRYQAAS